MGFFLRSDTPIKEQCTSICIRCCKFQIVGHHQDRLATIYRTVQVLLDLHVIDKVTFDDGFTRYELNGEESASGHRHHHAICTGCGKVYSLESDLLDSLEEEVMEKLGFLVTNHEVKLYGLCSECRTKNENKKEVMNREEREK